MKVGVDQAGCIVLKEVFNQITLETKEGEKLCINMRDTGFEFLYVAQRKKGINFEAKKGTINVWKPNNVSMR